MEPERDIKKDGLTTVSPLGGKIGSVQVSVRPVDPVLSEKLKEGMESVGQLKARIGEGSYLAVRSIDGFHCFIGPEGLASRGRCETISVIQYDPVRRTFLLSSSKGRMVPLLELLWYAFEVFSDERILLIYGITGKDPLAPPDRTEDRVSYYLSIIRSWKENANYDIGSMKLWRGSVLSSLLDHIKEIDPGPDQSRSQ